MTKKPSRRQFLQAAAAATGSAALLGRSASAQSRRARGGGTPRFRLALASYTLRKFDLEKTLAMTQKVGLDAIAFKSFHLPMNASQEQIRDAAAKTKAAGLNLYGCGVVYMNSEAEVNQAFDYAKTAGMTTIIGVPKPELLPLVDRKVKEYDLIVAIHNHGPGDKVYPTPEVIYNRVKGLDGRIGICMDVGHTQRMGIDPSEDARKYADRLLDVHLKDVNKAEASGSTVEMGRGVIDIPRFLRTLVDIGYSRYAAFEYEKDADDPLAGLAESVGYTRGVLAAM